MTASPCLSIGTSNSNLTTHNSTELFTNNTTANKTLLSCDHVLDHSVADRLFEALQCADQRVTSQCGIPGCTVDNAEDSRVKCDDPVRLHLAKLQLLLTLAGKTVASEAQTMTTLPLSPSPSSYVSTKMSPFAIQSSVCDTSGCQKLNCTVADELQHRNENVIAATLPGECTTKSSPNLLHQLLSGADIAQVRNRSGLIETNFCALGTPESSSTHKQVTPLEVSTSFGAVDQSTCHCTCPSSASTHTTASVSSSPVPIFTAGSNVTEFCSTQPRDTSSVCGNSALPLLPFTEKLLALLKEMESATAVSSSVNSCGAKSSSIDRAYSVPSLDGTPESADRNVYAETSDNINSHYLRQLLVARLRPSTPSSNGDEFPAMSQSPTHVVPRSQAGTNDRLSSSSGMLGDTATSPVSILCAAWKQQQEQPQGRPRCYSDLEQGMRYRHKLHRAHRPRSHSKTAKSAGSVCGFIETEKLTRDLESSLFAQLVLNSDPPSHCETDSFPFKMNGIRPPTAVTSPVCESHSIGSNTILTCVTPSRECVFEWLREADLFIAEHCREIPLGTLLAVAISPARTNLIELCKTLFSSPSSEMFPSSAKRATAKMWHQFLLLSLCEHRCVPTVSVLPTRVESPTGLWRDGFGCQHPAKHKLLNALYSLAELEAEDPLPVDTYLVEELTDFVSTATSLNLGQNVYKSLRFCILAQNAHPHHFSTSYTEALSELQAELSDSGESWVVIQVLKLLNRLHCFDSGSLKLFFGLSSDPLPPSLLHNTGSVSPSVCFPHSNHDMYAPLSFKRKAGHPHTFLSGENDSDKEISPVRMRSRAYTTYSYNKSARLSEISATGQTTMRNRSDTIPTEQRTGLRRKALVS